MQRLTTCKLELGALCTLASEQSCLLSQWGEESGGKLNVKIGNWLLPVWNKSEMCSWEYTDENGFALSLFHLQMQLGLRWHQSLIAEKGGPSQMQEVFISRALPHVCPSLGIPPHPCCRGKGAKTTWVRMRRGRGERRWWRRSKRQKARKDKRGEEKCAKRRIDLYTRVNTVETIRERERKKNWANERKGIKEARWKSHSSRSRTVCSFLLPSNFDSVSRERKVQ